MRIVVLGATGRAGRPIVEELLWRGHQVDAVARNPASEPAAARWMSDDLSDVSRIVEIARGADAIVSAYAPPRDDTQQLVVVVERLIQATARLDGPRLFVVGGCGSLQFAPGVTVIDSGHWPEPYLPIARSHAQALSKLRASSIDWTYFSPPMSIMPGERTGVFELGSDDLIRDADGKSAVSFEDYAVAVVDELERPTHRRVRFTIGYGQTSAPNLPAGEPTR